MLNEHHPGVGVDGHGVGVRVTLDVVPVVAAEVLGPLGDPGGAPRAAPNTLPLPPKMATPPTTAAATTVSS